MALVRRALQLPLPGAAAQQRLSPRPRTLGVTPPAEYRDGGVLLLLYPRDGELHLVLTRRTDHLPNHAGQVSLPGGLREPRDANLTDTALRETREELGLAADGIELLGPLTPLEIPVSGYRIHPWVAYTPRAPTFVPEPQEVAEVIEVPLSRLLDPATTACELRTIRGVTVTVPFFFVAGHKVWGATAMVLSEFVEVLKAAGAG
ncbi:MAG: NUDIX hydrolase [Anaerolineae bacterium]